MIQAALPGAKPEREFLERLHRDTAGNPFFVLEAIRLLRSDGLVRHEEGHWVIDSGAKRAAIPERVHDVLAQRLSGLGAGERQLLEAAACEGTTFCSSTLASCLNRERIEILSSLQTLEREHRLIHPEEENYRFDHPMIRETLYDEILPELRREYHRRIAGHLVTLSGGDLLSGLSPGSSSRSPSKSVSSMGVAQQRTEAAAIAYQLLEAREETRAIPYLLVSAGHARTLFANRDAEASLDRAVEILDTTGEDGGLSQGERSKWRVKAYKERGRIHVRVGALEKARADFESMRIHAGKGGMPDKEAHAENLLADLCVRTGDYTSALGHARDAYELARAAGDRHSLASALAVMGIIHFHHGEFDEALSAHSRAITLQQSIQDQSGYADSLNKIGNIHLRQGRTEEALTAYTTALAVAQETQHGLNEAEALNNIGAVHHERGETEEALRHYIESLRLKREIGDQRSIARSLNNLGLLYEASGEFGKALEMHQESLALKRDLGDQAGLSSSQSNLGSLLEKMGEYGRALECCEESLALKEAIGETWSIPYCKNALGRVGLALNALEGAERLFVEALEGTREQGDRPEECRSVVNLAEVRLAAGRADEARQGLGQAGRLAVELGLREIRTEIHYLEGLAALARSDSKGAREALGRLKEARSPASLAHEEVLEKHLEGRVLKDAGKGPEAQEALEQALNVARDVGLRGLEWKILADTGRTDDAREALLTLAEGIPSPGMRERFLDAPRAAELLKRHAR
jgi:tetratricopeptide (TPR) repeat protein